MSLIKASVLKKAGIPLEIHSYIYFGTFLLLAFNLTIWQLILSIAQLSMAANWILEGDFKRKWNVLKQRKSIWIIGGIVLIHFLGLIHTENIAQGFKDLKIKLPILALPLIIGTSKPLSFKQIKTIIYVFCAGVFISTLISIGKFIITEFVYLDSYRGILSVFISHIRYSLYINIAIFSLLYLTFSKKYPSLFKHEKKLSFIIIIWLILFLFLLQSFTGIFIFLFLSIFVAFIFTFKLKNLIARWFCFVFCLTMPLLPISYVTKIIRDFYRYENVDFSKLEIKTKQGNFYQHKPNRKNTENGNYTWIYVCPKELKQAWEKRSKYSLYGNNKQNQSVYYTVVRYMSSKGLRKDTEGITQLSNEDIKYIEAGCSNYLFPKRGNIFARIYQIIWEIDIYLKGACPNGHSLTQRFEFIKTAFNIVKNNFWIGVGTGDLKEAYKKQYEKDKSCLNKKYRLRAHSQWITFFVALGIIGGIICLICLILPIILEKKQTDFLMIIFILTAFLSMINEDTLESQAGVTFFAFFYAFFLYNNSTKSIKINS